MAHRFLGRVALALGLVNISLGVFLGLAHIIVWAVWFAYLCLALLIYFVAETNSKFEGQPYGEQYITHKYNIRGAQHGLIMDDKSAFDNATLESEGWLWLKWDSNVDCTLERKCHFGESFITAATAAIDEHFIKWQCFLFIVNALPIVKFHTKSRHHALSACHESIVASS